MEKDWTRASAPLSSPLAEVPVETRMRVFRVSAGEEVFPAFSGVLFPAGIAADAHARLYDGPANSGRHRWMKTSLSPIYPAL